jgi:hypothetical protein
MSWNVVAALAYGLAAVTLGGCASSADVQRQSEATCTKAGFQVGTPEFAVCLKRQELLARCDTGPLSALHIKPHPGELSCPVDPA